MSSMPKEERMEYALSAPPPPREALAAELRGQFSAGREMLSTELCNTLAELLTQQPDPKPVFSQIVHECARTMRPGDLAGHADFSRIAPVLQGATWENTDDYRLAIQRIVAWMQEHHGPHARELLAQIVAKLRSPTP